MSTTTILKPHYTTRHPLAGEKVPLTIFDRAAIDTFIVFLFAYRAPSPTNEALMEGLRRAVALYPLLAGRLAVDGHRGRRFLHVNDEGVHVVEATVPVDLAGVLADGAFVGNLADLYPALPEESVGAALLHIKLSRYRCGGLVIGVIWHHHAADGHSMSSFLTTWASAVRAGEAFAVPAPFLDRAAAAVPRSVPAPAFDHRSTEFRGEEGRSYPVVAMDKIKNLAVRFSAEFIAELKARVGARCTTFQCVLAHVWKKTTAARGLQPDEFTQVRIAVNCRRRADPPAPAEFFGNMVLWAFPRLQVRDLLSSSYGGVVAAIRDAVARVDGEYIRSFVDFGADGEELTATAAAPGTVFCPDMEVDSWLGFRFHEIDFGSGPQSAFLPPDLPVEGLMIFIPSCRAAKGGVDVFMAVAEDHVKAFQQICHSLD